MAAVTEAPGSRREWEDVRWVHGERLFFGLRTDTAFPVEGGNSGNSLFVSALADEGRGTVLWRCVGVRKDDWSIPGLRIWTARYRGIRPRPSGAIEVTADALMGSCNEWSDAQYSYGEMLWVGSTSDVFPAPDGYCFYTPRGLTVESGVTGRRCVSRRLDPVSYPGAVICRAVYKAVIVLA